MVEILRPLSDLETSMWSDDSVGEEVLRVIRAGEG
jgi:hypothetical protein